MRCAIIHAFPPHRYNLQAPTANPYQILKHAPSELELELYYFAGMEENRKSSEECIKALRLGLSHEMPRPAGVSKYYHISIARARGLPGSVGMFPALRDFAGRVNESHPDLVWMYPHWLLDWMPRLSCENIVVTGPDSAVLHNERALQYGDLDPRETKRQVALLKRNSKLELQWGSTRARMHMVGEADAERYIRLNEGRAEAFFVKHPIYDHATVNEGLAGERGKVSVMFSGGGETIFVGSHLRRAIDSIASHAEMAGEIELRFLGRGYKDFATKLTKAGFECCVTPWVEDYERELAQAQIHVFPIAVGTGTKGKVLTAIATGSLVIGSEFALENIAVTPGTDCIKYDKPEEMGGILRDVLDRREHYARMAESGARRVAGEHDPAKVAKEFWDRAMNPGL
ncbi:MAG: glycosyltransferase [Methanomassiliicoccales archaeon]|nr:glycosyltransferase [Methanomassiliicoccales archaeon]